MQERSPPLFWVIVGLGLHHQALTTIVLGSYGIYEQRLAEAEHKGVQNERRTTIENLLRFQFGTLDEQLSAIVENIVLWFIVKTENQHQKSLTNSTKWRYKTYRSSMIAERFSNQVGSTPSPTTIFFVELGDPVSESTTTSVTTIPRLPKTIVAIALASLIKQV